MPLVWLFNENCKNFTSLAYGKCEKGWIFNNETEDKWQYLSGLKLSCNGSINRSKPNHITTHTYIYLIL